MAYITFIYFLCVFIYIIHKHGLDIGACIIGIYMITSLCSIYLLKNDVEYIGKEPTIFPSIVYCSMITLVTYPFYKFNSNRKRVLPVVDMKVFNIISWVLICGFIFAIFLFKDDIMLRLAMGNDIGQLRGMANSDFGNAQASLSGPLRAVSSFFMIILSMSPISFILFFYSVTYLKKPFYFNVLLLLSSLGSMIGSIIGIDRSIFFYWIIDFVFIYILFRPYLSPKTIKLMNVFACVAFSGAGSYLYLMTYSRFGDDALASVLNYMGQNYLNFCWFWDNYNVPNINWGFFFPITSHFFNIDWGMPVGAVSYGLFVESKVGYFVNLFYTFMGTVMLYLGQWAVIPFCFLFYKISDLLINKTKSFGIQTFIRIFIIAIVPYCGVILYLYVDYIRLMAALIMLYFCYKMDRKYHAKL